MACKTPCDGFKNNLLSGKTAKEMFEKWCKTCDYWTGEDHSKYKGVKCKECLDHGYCYSVGSAAESYPRAPVVEKYICSCQH